MRKPGLLLAALLMLTVTGFSQTVDEIIAKNIAAKGGLAKIKAVQTERVEGSMEIGGMQANLVRIAKRPNKMRLEINLQGMTLIQAFDGQNGWQVVPFTGKKDPEPMTPDDQERVAQDADIDGPLVDYKEKGNKVELIGKEKMEGTDVYHLKLTLKSGDVRDLFLDAGSFLEIKSRSKTMRRGTEMVMDSSFSDYKEVQGLMVPFSIEIRTQGAPGGEQKLAVQKFEVNSPVNDNAFQMPVAASVPPAEKTAPASSPERPKKSDGGSKPPQQ
jgi:outer membrane lipoprotein-sorting protein